MRDRLMRDRSCRDRSAGRRPVAHRVHTLTPGVVTCASGAEFGRPCVKRRNWRAVSAPIFGSAAPGRSVFGRFTVWCSRLAYRAPDFHASTACRPDFCRLLPRRPLFPIQMPGFGALIDSRRDFCRFPPRNAPRSPFCTERAILHRKRRWSSQLRTAEATRSAESCTGRSAPSVLRRAVARANQSSHHAGCLAHGSP